MQSSSAITVALRFIFPSFFMLSIFSAFAEVLHVPQEYDTIQSAIDSSSSGDTILVAEGEYREELFITNLSLTLASEFIIHEDPSFIESTSILGRYAERPLTINSTENDTVFVIGLTFTLGAVFRDDAGPGGGIFARGVDIYLYNNVIYSNWAESVGGVYLDSCNGTILNNCIESNVGVHAAGGICVLNGIYHIEGNNISYNSTGWTSGGLLAEFSSGNLEENYFSGNYAYMVGGGARISNNETWIIERNVFRGNTSGRGGGLWVSSIRTVTIHANLFEDNVATNENWQGGDGGGLSLAPFNNFVLIENNRFTGNTAYYAGGAANLKDSCIVTCNIFANNRGLRVGALSSHSANGSTPWIVGTNNLFENNSQIDTNDVYYWGAVSPARSTIITLEENDFTGNSQYAAGFSDRDWNDDTLNVENNYWGHSSGPYHSEDNAEGLGDTVMTDVDIIPFAEEPFTDFQPPDEFSLNYPTNGDTNERLPVRFSWEPADDLNDDEVYYTVVVSRSELFEDSLLFFAGTDTSCNVKLFEFETTYWWKVFADDELWLRRWSSETWEVFVTSERFEPEPFDLGEPEPYAVIDEQPVLFTWDKSIDYTFEDEVNYTLEIALAENFDDPFSHDAGTDTFIRIDELDFENVYHWRVVAEDNDGHRTYSNDTRDFHLTYIDESQLEGIPRTWEITAVYPNPFNPVVKIIIGVPYSGKVTAEIYDLLGRRVAVLTSGKMSPGYHHLHWWSRSSSGIYFLRISSDSGWHATRKLLFVK